MPGAILSLFFKQRCINDLNLEGMDQYVVVMPASAVFDNYDSTQPATSIPVTQKTERIQQEAELNTAKYSVQNADCRIQGLSIQGWVLLIMKLEWTAHAKAEVAESDTTNLTFQVANGQWTK